MAEAAILDVRIEFRRDGFALRANFELRSPWTVLFGASGAGKTTLLRILAGLMTPTDGSVRMGDRRLFDNATHVSVRPGQRGIGFVMQQAALFPHLTVRENVGYGVHRRTRRERETRSDEMLHFFEIERLAERKPRRLSGGERQRVAIAQALATRPELLLLDEPFNALDAASRSAIIEKLRSTKVPVLYVSHDLGDAWQSNADALLLENGQIVARGEARNVLAAQRLEILQQLDANG